MDSLCEQMLTALATKTSEQILKTTFKKDWKKTQKDEFTLYEKGDLKYIHFHSYYAKTIAHSKNIQINNCLEVNLPIPLDSILVEQLPLALLKMKNQVEENTVNFFKDEYSKKYPNKKNDILQNGCSFEEVPLLFNIDDAIVTNQEVAGIVTNIGYGASFFGEYVDIEYTGASFLKNGNIAKVKKHVSINSFSGKKLPQDLSVKILDEDTKAKLTERGTLLTKLLTTKYLQCSGTVSQKIYWDTIEYRSEGRVVIDTANFCRFEPNLANNYIANGDGVGTPELWQYPNRVYGYSLIAKKWGEFKLKDLSEITFRENVMENLVLDESKKKLLLTVTGTPNQPKDFIDGKGGGVIFLLHGPPGCGKTLTAEATAETLKRPLYSISVGELGTNPETLENRLRQILDLASAWKAVLLLDEADIYLEARASGDVVRNSMVGVFLRLLEYHQGVLFLTTNRVTDFDEAFKSRISLAFAYKPIDDVRDQVWAKILKNVSSDLDPKECAKLGNFNGREIKNMVALACSLAITENNKLGMEHLKQVLQVHEEFTNSTRNTRREKKKK